MVSAAVVDDTLHERSPLLAPEDTLIAGAYTLAMAFHWLSYVSVEEVDATSRAVREAGGSVADPPMDIRSRPVSALLAPARAASISRSCVFRVRRLGSLILPSIWLS